MAKGIASGLPLGVRRACRRDDVAAWRPREHVRRQSRQLRVGARDDQVLREGSCATRDVGPHLKARLDALKDKYPLIGDVRGKGLMIGVELVRDRATKERATTERDQLVQEMFKRGVLILGAGRNAIRFAPPLVLSKDQADVIADTFDKALADIRRT